MPSKTPKQARFMRAVAHGWKPSRVKAPPVSVAKEFVEADKKYSGGFAESRYAKGGLAFMNELDSNSERQRPLQQLGNWQEGGEVDYEVSPGHYEAPTVEDMGPAMEQMLRDMETERDARNREVIDYTWDKTKPIEAETQLDERLEAMSGPEQVEYVKPRLLAAMREMKTIGESPFGKRYSIWDYGQSQKQVNLWRDKWSKALQKQAREAEGEEKEMQRGGRVIPLDGGIRSGMRRAALTAQGYQYDPVANVMRQPEQTVAGQTGTSITGPSGSEATTAGVYDPYYGAGTGARFAGPRGGRRGGRGGRRDGGGPGPRPGGGPGGPGAAPPRIVPTDPASYVGASADVSGRESPYREQLRQHKANIASILGSARGGPVNYQEGGEVRPGHAEGPNPYPPGSARYSMWERKYHKDPAPPPPPPAAEEEEDIPWWKKLTGYGSEEAAAKIEREVAAAEEGKAYGGRVNYQTGGLAIAAPAGGVPPWIEPTGVEPQGYQFGGFASRFAPAARAAFGRGAPRGGGFLNRLQQAQQAQQGQPRGGLFAALQRGDPRLRVTGRTSRTLPPGIDPRAVAANPQGYAQWAADPRSAAARGVPTGPPVDMQLPPFNRTPSGEIDLGGGRTPEWGPDAPWRQPPQGPMAPGGGPLQLPIMNRPSPNVGRPGYDQIGDMGPITPGGGNIPPWKRLPGQRRQVPPSPGRAYPGGPGGPVPGGEQLPMGGARVPPNQQGYLQRMRMMNRPPSGPVGGGANRVGMRDQQGALSRAMQRGTGRPPMSRRYAFGRGAQQP